MINWKDVERPGYFGRQRDNKVTLYNTMYGHDGWQLVWRFDGEDLTFRDACSRFYEESYYRHLAANPADVDFICSFAEVIDNAPSNVLSGMDYTKQESYSTHIQDIAVRNVLGRLGRWFENKRHDEVLVIRSKDSSGYKYGPGNIPFMDPKLIVQPSLCPLWANKGTVEDAWQSNKYLQVKAERLP